MTLLGLDGIVAELLARLRAYGGQPVDVSASDLRGWLPEAVAALLAGNVLLPSAPASSVVCDGCEEACVRPVQFRTRQSGETVVLVHCDVREDIDLVFLTPTDLQRWRFTLDSLAAGLAALLPNGRSTAVDAPGKDYRLGFVKGRRHDRGVLYLRNDHGPRLTLAGHVLAPQDVLTLTGDRLSLDTRLLTRCVDAPVEATEAAPPESQESQAKRMLARKRELQNSGARAFLQTIADEEECSTSWVKQLIAKASKPNPFAGIVPQAAQKPTVSMRSKPPR